MTLKTHSGSCHCGAVRFAADIDITQGTIKCNCSSCTKARSWLAFVAASRYQVPLLNDIDPEELAAAPIQYVDGLHDRFDRRPADTRFL